MFAPVMTGLCDDGNDVLDLFFNWVRGSRGERESQALEASGDVLHHDGSGKPSRHSGTGTVHADPSGNGGRLRTETGDHGDSAADFVYNLSISIGLRVYVFFASGFEKCSFVRRTACHCQVAKRSPYLIPCYLSIWAVFQTR